MVPLDLRDPSLGLRARLRLSDSLPEDAEEDGFESLSGGFECLVMGSAVAGIGRS